jgi:hypothetical protein
MAIWFLAVGKKVVSLPTESVGLTNTFIFYLKILFLELESKISARYKVINEVMHK